MGGLSVQSPPFKAGIAGLTRNPCSRAITFEAWMPDRVRHDGTRSVM
jgi:hypothetical protein